MGNTTTYNDKLAEYFGKRKTSLFPDGGPVDPPSKNLWDRLKRGIQSISPSPLGLANTLANYGSISPLGPIGDVMAPMSIPGNMVQASYTPGVSVGAAMRGQDVEKGFIEEILTDPLTYFGGATIPKQLKSLLSIHPKDEAFIKFFQSKDGAEYIKNWYADPVISERISRYNAKKLDPYYGQYHFNDPNLNEIKILDYANDLKRDFPKDYKQLNKDSDGVSLIDKVYVRNGLENTRKQSVIAHELNHAVNRNSIYNKFESDALIKPFGATPEFKQQGFFMDTFFPKRSDPYRSYFTSPTEVHARMQQARHALGKKPGDIFTEKDYKVLKKYNNFNDMGKYIKDKDSFIDLMNSYYQDGGTVDPPKKKKGQRAIDFLYDGKLADDRLEKKPIMLPQVNIKGTSPVTYVTNPKDLSYLKYKDSLNLYNSSRNLLNYIDKSPEGLQDYLLNRTYNAGESGSQLPDQQFIHFNSKYGANPIGEARRDVGYEFYIDQYKKPTQKVVLNRGIQGASLPNGLTELDYLDPLSLPEIKPPSTKSFRKEGEYLMDYEGVPNVKVVFTKVDGKPVPTFYQNADGERIPYGEKLTRQFQYNERPTGEYKTGGPILGPLVGLMSLFGGKEKASDPVQNFAVPSNNNVSVAGNNQAAKPPYFMRTSDSTWVRQPLTFGDAGSQEMNKMWESKTESAEPFKRYSLNENGIKLTEGHLRGAKIPNSLIQDVKTVGAKYGVDPMDLLSVAGAESTFGYGPFGGVRVSDNQISDDDLFTYNDFTTKPPKTFEEFAFDQGRNIIHTKDFNGHYFEVPETEHEEIYNDQDLKKKYTKYLSKFENQPRQRSVLDLIAKRIAEKGIGAINPGDSTYTDRVLQYKEMLKNNRTPIKFQQGGYAADPLNFVFPSRGLVPDYAQDGLSGYFEDPLMLPHAKGGGFFGNVWRGIKKGIGGIGKGIGAAADQTLSFFGAPNVIQNSVYDQKAPQWAQSLNSGVGNAMTGVLGAAIPGVGLGLGLLSGLGRSAQGQGGGFDVSSLLGGQQQQDTNQYNVGSLLQGLMGGQQSSGGNQQQFGTALGQLLGNFQGQGQFGGTPGFAGQPRYYEEGGEVEQGPAMIPIQTEKGEVFIHLDGSITPVNAKTTHKKMDEDEVTDVVPEGTYVTSNDKKIRMTLKQAEEIVMGLKAQPYEEFKKGVLPEEQLFSEIFGNAKKMTPAEMTQKILRKFPTMDRSTTWDKNDIFTELTNKENMNNRLPWLEQVIMFNESRRGKPSQTFKQGGVVKMDGVRHLPKGGSVSKFPKGGDILSVLGTAAPFLLDLFGANKGSSIDPIARNMILGSSPLYASGVNSNINAQNNQLGTAIQDFTGLGQNLNTFAGASAGANIAGRLAQDTEFQRFDPRLQDQRLANFQTRTPNAVIDALSTPRYDLNALAGTLGPRGFNTFASQMVNNDNETRNNAIVGQFNQDRNVGLNVLGQRNALDSFSQQFNIGQGEKQQQARNAQTAGVFGDVSSYFGRLGDIQSQILPITTQLALQKAGLAGQKEMNIAQNLMNTGSIYAQLGNQGNSGGNQGGNQGGGNYDFLKSLIFDNMKMQNQQQTQQQIGTIGQNRVNTNRGDFMNPQINPYLNQPALQQVQMNPYGYNPLDPYGRPKLF